MDECWLDLTGCRLDPVTAAEEIRATTKSELGLTVSIGVSFNKIFAKLGSDMGNTGFGSPSRQPLFLHALSGRGHPAAHHC